MYQDRMAPILAELLATVGWEDAPLDRLEIVDDGLSLPTPWPVTANAIAALAAVGLAASRIHEIRTGEKRVVRVSTLHAGLSMASSSYLLIDGKAAKFRDPFTGFYEAANDRWVFLHGNFPHLRDGVLEMLGVQNVDDVPHAVKKRDPFELEAEGIAKGLCVAAVRTREEWLAEPQAEAVLSQKLLSVNRIGDAPLRAISSGTEPLSGLRMLDLSRVIAGPMSARTVAEFGGEVLLISGPNLPSIESLVIDTGFGKRAVFIDLRKDSETLERLLSEADIFLDAYRPGALAAKGFDAQSLSRKHPGIIHIDLDAFSKMGPWSGRRGYDSLVQATTGMCWDGKSKPRNLPCQPLDYLSGYLAAFGAMIALIRQYEEGGSWSVRLSLAQTSEWMWSTYSSLGAETAMPDTSMTFEQAASFLAEYQTDFGLVTALKSPLQDAAWHWPSVPVPLGTHDPAWIA